MRTERLKEAAARYGTPLYVYDLDILREQMTIFRKKLGTDIGLCFAMKANAFLTAPMAAMTERIEICSFGEYQICRKLGIAPEKMLISGVLKKREELQIVLGACGENAVYTAESVRQFFLLSQLARENRRTLRVYLRLSSGNQFGMDEKTICSLIRERAQHSQIQIEGLHYFSGTQKKSETLIGKELEKLDAFLCRTEKEEKFCWKHLEYGPGMGVAYFRGKNGNGAAGKEGAVSEDRSASRTAGENTEVFQPGILEITERIRKMKWKGKITLEMGRALTAMCGYYLTEIQDCKRTEGRSYCIVDGGSHQMNYDGQVRGLYQPVIRVLDKKMPDNSKNTENWTICGALCTVSDILAANVCLGDVKVGDQLVFERTGAYSSTEGMALFLSHALPAVVLYSERTGWKLVRRKQETYPWNMDGSRRCGEDGNTD